MHTDTTTPKRKKKEQESSAQERKKVESPTNGNVSTASPEAGSTPGNILLDKESIEALSIYVESKWNIADDGEIKKVKNRWFRSDADDKKGYPLKALYFNV